MIKFKNYLLLVLVLTLVGMNIHFTPVFAEESAGETFKIVNDLYYSINKEKVSQSIEFTSDTPSSEPVESEQPETVETTYDLELLAHVIMGESEGATLQGMMAVGQVILFRCEKYGQTIEEVIYTPGQFECTDNGHINKTPSQEAYEAAMRVLNGEYVLEWGTEFFYAPEWVSDTSTIQWFESMVFVGYLDGHRFFKT